mgnify:FL=1
MLFDTHCHLQFNSFKDDRPDALTRSLDRGLILNVVGTQIDTSRAAVAFAEQYDNIYATIGLHPIHTAEIDVDEEETSFISRAEVFDYDEYLKLGRSPKVIGIGECGLELFHLPPELSREEILTKQIEIFRSQFRLAEELRLPLVLHVSEAHPEMIDLLKSYNRPIRGVVHCFTGDWTNAQEYLKLGLHIGLGGVITFPPKKLNPETQLGLTEAILKIPLEKIVVETDSPYLAPQAYRGKRCEPWMAEETVKKIAEIKKLGVYEVNEAILKNSLELFNVSIVI